MLRKGAIAALVLAVLALVWFANGLRAFDPSNTTVHTVTIAPGVNAAAVGRLLYGRGLIRSATAFRVYLRLTGLGVRMQAGAYEITTDMSAPAIAQTLAEGDVATYSITFLPGKRLADIKQTLVAAGFEDYLVEGAFDPALYAGHPALAGKPDRQSLEGYVYPDTYQYSGTTTLPELITRSLDLSAGRLNAATRGALAKQNLSAYQGVILASIVEQEVSDAAVKPMVAQVFLSRLKKGMSLGSDVTAYYGGALRGLKEAVSTRTRYNTRIYRGFPPGPIGSFSDSSLRAVVEPAATDFLYFVAGDDGNTYFSRTLAEHQQLIEQHCKILCAIE